MPHLNGTGPENKGEKTGRGLGQCNSLTNKEALGHLGKGLGLRRKKGGGKGMGKRLNSSSK